MTMQNANKAQVLAASASIPVLPTTRLKLKQNAEVTNTNNQLTSIIQKKPKRVIKMIPKMDQAAMETTNKEETTS